MNSGIYTVIPTFFNNDNSVNLEMLEIHLLEQHRMGYNKFVFLGTTSETPTLSIDEMKAIKNTVIRLKRSERDTYVFGVGGNDPIKVKNIIRELDLINHSDVIMISAPYYNKPSQQGLITYFTDILSSYPNQKFMLYNIPGRTAVNIEVNSFKIIKSLNNNFIAIKEASGDIRQMMDLVYELSDVKVFSGDDKLALPGYSIGTKGTISVASNLTPLVNLLYQSFQSDRRGIELNKFLNNINNLLFIDSNPVPLKYLLSLKYKNKTYYNVRSPLVATDKINKNKLDEVNESLNNISMNNIFHKIE